MENSMQKVEIFCHLFVFVRERKFTLAVCLFYSPSIFSVRSTQDILKTLKNKLNFWNHISKFQKLNKINRTEKILVYSVFKPNHVGFSVICFFSSFSGSNQSLIYDYFWIFLKKESLKIKFFSAVFRDCRKI